MKLLFCEVYEQYKNYIDSELKEQSKKAVNDRIKNHILPYFKNYNIHEIKEIDYLNWKIYIEKKNLSYKYMKTLHTTMVTFLNYCMKYYNLNKNIASIVGTFKDKGYKKREFDYYTYKEFKQFIKYIDNEIYKQFFNLMFFTGTRPGEAMALKFSDLNKFYIDINKTISERIFKNNERYIGTPKTKSSIRKIAIDKKLYKDLIKLKKYYIKKYNSENYDYFIFGGLKPLAPTTINRYKEKACIKAKIKNIRLHDFRHSHATLLLNNKIYIKEISKRLGHSKTSTTLDIYIHTNKKQEKKVIKTLNFLRLF